MLALAGGVFVAEAGSVLIQRSWFKFTKYRYGEGRRVFLMAPLHHHFEKMGWHESQVVTRFYILCVLCAVLALSTIKITMNRARLQKAKIFRRQAIFPLAKNGFVCYKRKLKRRRRRSDSGEAESSPACSSVDQLGHTLKRVFSCFEASEARATQSVVAFGSRSHKIQI